MADESAYRTPHEIHAHSQTRARITPVLSRALSDARMVYASMQLDAEPAVFQLWCDRLWSGVNRLTPQDRAEAIVMLIEHRAEHEATLLMTVDEPDAAAPPPDPATVGRTVRRRRRWWPFGGAR